MPRNEIATTIRIDADTGGAEQAIARVERGFGVMKDRSLPALSQSFKSSSTAALMMSSALSDIGVRGSALSGPLHAVVSGLGAIHPLLWAVSAAGAAVATMMLNQKSDAEELVKELSKYHGVLVDLSTQYGKIGDIVRDLAREENERIRVQMKQVELQIQRLLNGEKEVTLWSRLKDQIIKSLPEYEFMETLWYKGKAASEKQRAALLELLKTYADLKAQLVSFGKGDIHDITVTGSKKKGAQLAEIERQLYFLDLVGKATERVIVLERERGTVALMAAKQTQQGIDWTVKAYGVLARTLSSINLQQLKEQGGAAAFLVRTTGEAIKAVLETYAKLWTAQGVAMSIENPVGAAAKFRAAALAGVGIGLVEAITSNAAAAIEARGNAIYGEGVGNTSGPDRISRTTISQGPITLNYTSSIYINGSVFGFDDLKAIVDGWNRDNLRAAGYDVEQRARG